MSNKAPDATTIRSFVELATRAPSVHNSQPWRWLVTADGIDLYADYTRQVAATDPNGRQLVMSCGAALNHFETAAAADGWLCEITRLPESGGEHLAHIVLKRALAHRPEAKQLVRAIGRRHTDRLPYWRPEGWSHTEARLITASAAFDVALATVPPSSRDSIAYASDLARSNRRYDSSYKAELQWWTGHTGTTDGVPASSLVSGAENSRVPLGRKFPSRGEEVRRQEVGVDHAVAVVLSTPDDTPASWLRCGEALSAVLLEATHEGLSTCPLTHLTELPTIRTLVGKTVTDGWMPQVVVRIGHGRPVGEIEATPRRSVDEVLKVVADAR